MKPNRIGTRLIKIATVYLVAGLVLGLTMAITEDHSLSSVHSHIGLLGWATLAITGIVYLVLPACAASRLAGVHFWLHNMGLPVMTIGLVVLFRGNSQAEPVVAIGSVVVLVSLLVFAGNVLKNASAATEPASRAL